VNVGVHCEQVYILRDLYGMAPLCISVTVIEVIILDLRVYLGDLGGSRYLDSMRNTDSDERDSKRLKPLELSCTY